MWTTSLKEHHTWRSHEWRKILNLKNEAFTNKQKKQKQCKVDKGSSPL